MLGEIDHVEIEASDAEEMVDFFEALGYEEVRRTDRWATSPSRRRTSTHRWPSSGTRSA